MKKRILLLTTLLAISLVGCGKEAPAATEEQPVEAAVEQAEETPAPAEEVKNIPTEFTIATMMENDYPDSIDISGCDTFTQIVDKKLTAGMGYTNADIGDDNLLLVTSGTWDNQDGNNAAMDAILYVYTDGVPTELGKVCSQGTAYPLTMSGQYLFVAGHQWICKYTVAEGQLQIMEMASVEWAEGEGDVDKYFYESADGGDYTNMTQEETEKIYNQLYDEMAAGEVINFDVIQ